MCRGCRIIPARAGSTDRCCCRPTMLTDHPRSRGVYARPAVFIIGKVGSSPLARGLPPTCRLTPGLSQDHPRSRGVYAG